MADVGSSWVRNLKLNHEKELGKTQKGPHKSQVDTKVISIEIMGRWRQKL